MTDHVYTVSPMDTGVRLCPCGCGRQTAIGVFSMEGIAYLGAELERRRIALEHAERECKEHAGTVTQLLMVLEEHGITDYKLPKLKKW